jgi:arylformamidase
MTALEDGWLDVTVPLEPGMITVDLHCALLSAGIWIVEGLDLSAVEPGDYELLCLPLRIVGSDGAPARVLVRPLS